MSKFLFENIYLNINTMIIGDLKNVKYINFSYQKVYKF